MNNIIGNDCFDKFVANISVRESEKERMQSSHKNVSNILKKSNLSEHIEKTLLVGSYILDTGIKKIESDSKKVDVDLAVIFKKDSFKKPEIIIDKIIKILNKEKNYKGKVMKQKRSVGIELSKTHVDVVPFLRIHETKDIPLYISSINRLKWEYTNPICHRNHYGNEKNKKPNLISYVKVLKWIKKNHAPQNIKYPSGIALTELVSKYYDDSNIKIVGFINTLSKIKKYNQKVLKDPCNNKNDLLGELTQESYNNFIKKINQIIKETVTALNTKDKSKLINIYGNEISHCTLYSNELKQFIQEKTKENKNFGL